MRVLKAVVSLLALDRDGITLSQTTAGAEDLLINGALASSGSVTFSQPHTVSIYGVSDESGRTFTVYGTDRSGTSITEVLTGPTAGATRTGAKLFKTVTRIAVSAATVGLVEAGVIGTGYSRWLFAPNPYKNSAVTLRTFLAGTATYEIQATSMRMNANSSYAGGDNPDDIIVITASGSIAVDENIITPYVAYRIMVTAQNADVTLRLMGP
jgi:hypothetical protein